MFANDCHNQARNPAHSVGALQLTPPHRRRICNSDEAGSDGTHYRPQPLLADETDAHGRAAVVAQPSLAPGQSAGVWRRRMDSRPVPTTPPLSGRKRRSTLNPSCDVEHQTPGGLPWR